MILKTWDLFLKICFKAAIGAENNNLLSVVRAVVRWKCAGRDWADLLPYVQ